MKEILNQQIVSSDDMKALSSNFAGEVTVPELVALAAQASERVDTKIEPSPDIRRAFEEL